MRGCLLLLSVCAAIAGFETASAAEKHGHDKGSGAERHTEKGQRGKLETEQSRGLDRVRQNTPPSAPPQTVRAGSDDQDQDPLRELEQELDRNVSAERDNDKLK